MSQLPKSLGIRRGLPPEEQLEHLIDRLEFFYEVLLKEMVASVTFDENGDVDIPNGHLTQDGIFGGIDVHNDSAAAQSIPTGTTYTKCTGFANNGPANEVTPDASNDKITLTRAGLYQVTVALQFSCGTNSVEWWLAPYLNAVEVDTIHVKQKLGTAGDLVSAAMVGVIDVATAPWDLDIRARHDNGGAVDLTIEYGNVSVIYLGET